jgi:hypothetical protein
MGEIVKLIITSREDSMYVRRGKKLAGVGA